MPSIGPLELVIVLVIILLIFGARRLPEIGRSLGDGMREFKDGITRRHGDKPVAGELESSKEEPGEAGDGDDDEKHEAVTSPPSRGSGDAGAYGSIRPLPDRVADQLDTVAHAELPHRVRAVVLDRLLRQMEDLGDLPVRVRLGDELHDLLLARRQLVLASAPSPSTSLISARWASGVRNGSPRSTARTASSRSESAWAFST